MIKVEEIRPTLCRWSELHMDDAEELAGLAYKYLDLNQKAIIFNTLNVLKHGPLIVAIIEHQSFSAGYDAGYEQAMRDMLIKKEEK